MPYKNSSDQNECQKRSYQKHKEERLEQNRKDYRKHRVARLAQMKERRVQREYGLDIDTYTELMNGPCEACDTTERKRFADHNHETGKFRGALCYSCNSALGMLGEDLERILALGRYLIKHELKDFTRIGQGFLGTFPESDRSN